MSKIEKVGIDKEKTANTIPNAIELVNKSIISRIDEIRDVKESLLAFHERIEMFLTKKEELPPLKGKGDSTPEIMVESEIYKNIMVLKNNLDNDMCDEIISIKKIIKDMNERLNI